nr:unnamed protein product [Digitaria exilis]
MTLYACCVRCTPSQLMRSSGLAHTDVPGAPHILSTSTLYAPWPPAPQHASNTAPSSNPASPASLSILTSRMPCCSSTLCIWANRFSGARQPLASCSAGSVSFTADIGKFPGITSRVAPMSRSSLAVLVMVRTTSGTSAIASTTPVAMRPKL